MPQGTKIRVDRSKHTSDSFLIFMRTHRLLVESFLNHQEALLRCDFVSARKRLRTFEQEIKRHIRDEETFLIPLYSRAGKIVGGDPQLFLGEHQRIIEFIARLRKLLPRKKQRGKKAARTAVEIFYQEAMFRWLLDHHDERERQILYPTLDRISTEAERTAILKKCALAF